MIVVRTDEFTFNLNTDVESRCGATYHFAYVQVNAGVIIFLHLVQVDEVVHVRPHVVVILDMSQHALQNQVLFISAASF